MIDLYNIRVNGVDTLWCSVCRREFTKPTSWLLPDLIEEAEAHLRAVHGGAE
jgi:hypothetical protein